MLSANARAASALRRSSVTSRTPGTDQTTARSKKRQLEAGVTLVQRTTRRLQLTPAGERFYARVKAILADLNMAKAELVEEARTIAGRLRISGPTLFGPRYLTPQIAAFLARHPKVIIALDLADEFTDPLDSGADVTIRIGETPVSGLTSRRLGMVRRVAFATPAYLAAHGRPARPADLAQHDCVLRLSQRDCWTFRQGGGAEEIVTVRGRFESNSVAALNQAVVAGLGIGVASFWQIRDLVEQGRVEVILAEYEPPPMPLQAMWPPTQRLPLRTRLLIDFLASRACPRKTVTAQFGPGSLRLEPISHPMPTNI
ncbi:transcriptional regulator, LysR family [Rhizobiales bacterium GAS191]|nr:transcriptional regulator, LysR family [Rhizobiales bacterium GAS191]